MVALIVVLIILGLLLIGFLSILLYIYWLIFYSPHKGQNEDYNIYTNPIYKDCLKEVEELINHIRLLPSEDVYTISKDKKKLHAKLIRVENSKKVAICCHGYHGTPYRDFSGGGARLHELGYNVLLIEQRAHKDSDGHTITFGRKEQYDILAWIKKVEEIFTNDIELVLVGISMGGASVLMVSNKLEKPCKIIADCPYNSIKDVLCSNIIGLGLNPKLVYPLVKLSALIFAHINTDHGPAIESVSESKCKFLIIHGNKDTIVPHHYSEDIYLANKDKVQYEIFDNTAHGMSYITDTKRYVKLVKDFLNS